MSTLRILSAGAAQAVTERVIESFRRDTGSEVVADFGAVGAMRARMTADEPVDVIILTRAMIDDLASTGWVEPGTRVDLGTVGTGVAVRAGSPAPDVASAAALRAAIVAAERIVCPDPAIATAGKIVVSMMDKLGVTGDVRERMQYFPNGYAAMTWLAGENGGRALGITQVTEILPNKGVSYAGPLPDEFQMKAVYSAGLAAKSTQAKLARDFIARFSAVETRALLADAGYELNA